MKFTLWAPLLAGVIITLIGCETIDRSDLRQYNHYRTDQWKKLMRKKSAPYSVRINADPELSAEYSVAIKSILTTFGLFVETKPMIDGDVGYQIVLRIEKTTSTFAVFQNGIRLHMDNLFTMPAIKRWIKLDGMLMDDLYDIPVDAGYYAILIDSKPYEGGPVQHNIESLAAMCQIALNAFPRKAIVDLIAEGNELASAACVRGMFKNNSNTTPTRQRVQIANALLSRGFIPKNDRVALKLLRYADPKIPQVLATLHLLSDNPDDDIRKLVKGVIEKGEPLEHCPQGPNATKCWGAVLN